MSRTFLVRRLARVAHPPDCRYLVSFFDNLLGAACGSFLLSSCVVLLLLVLLVVGAAQLLLHMLPLLPSDPFNQRS